MRPALEPILIECLDALENGEALELILQRYPAYAEELRPYLETAVQLERLPIQPTVAAEHTSKQNFLAQAAAMKAAPVVPFWKNWAQWLRLVTALALFLVLFLAGFTYTAATAVPGDLLYDSKLFIENARLQTAGPLQQIELVEQFNQERIAEINRLLAAGREEEVAFTGFITTVVDENHLIIADLTVLLSTESIVEGDIGVGYFAQVNGRTQNSAVLASHIIIASPPSADPITEPEPAQTPTPLPGATAVPSNTYTPTATVTSSPTTISTPTPTFSATPTASLTPLPTQTITPIPTVAPVIPTATPDDDDNENEDDNSNEDDDDNENSDDNDNDNEDDDNENDSNDNDNENDSDDNDNENDSNDNDNDNDSNDNDNDNDSNDNDNDNDSNDNDNENDGNDNDNENDSDDNDNENDSNDNDEEETDNDNNSND